MIHTKKRQEKTFPSIGWESSSPIENQNLNDYLSVQEGDLYLDEFNLSALYDHPSTIPGLPQGLGSPLEIVYLPIIPKKIQKLEQVFKEAIWEIGYTGRFLYTYPSKANAAEEVVRTVLSTGVHYEISTFTDIDLLSIILERNEIKPSQYVICNGFKPTGSRYADHILSLKQRHGNTIPVIDDLSELSFLESSGLSFDVGLRQKSYGHQDDIAEMDDSNSRFGMKLTDLAIAAGRIADAPNLTLRLYHAMVGSQVSNEEEFISRLTPAIEIYAKLRQRHPDLTIFDFGGGIPAPMALNFQFDYPAFVRTLLSTIQCNCKRFQVPEPDVMGEVGRYTVTEHGAHIFKVELVKENKSRFPWYIINGSIMTSFPDAWALGEHFTVLPLNHLQSPFQQVQIGGLTCDSDDIYPPRSSHAKIYLPVDSQSLYVGFFGIGAYQEMLGGLGGVKHCVIPEADELIIDRSESGDWRFQLRKGQTAKKIAETLGYASISPTRE